MTYYPLDGWAPHITRRINRKRRQRRRLNIIRRWWWHVACGYIFFTPFFLLYSFRHTFNAIGRTIDHFESKRRTPAH